ncbi:hypothetical protein MMPV_001363 [Pyropia vietnamensis]
MAATGGGPLSGSPPGVLAELASAAALAADAARSLCPPPDVTALARAAVAETASAATVWARLALRLATPAAAAAVAGVRATAPSVRAAAATATTRLLAQPPRVLAAQAAVAAAVIAAAAVEVRTGVARRGGRRVVATVEATRAAYRRRMAALRAQSRAVAAVAPHALVVVPPLAAWAAFPNAVGRHVGWGVVATLGVCWPAVQSLAVLYEWDYGSTETTAGAVTSGEEGGVQGAEGVGDSDDARKTPRRWASPSPGGWSLSGTGLGRRLSMTAPAAAKARTLPLGKRGGGGGGVAPRRLFFGGGAAPSSDADGVVVDSTEMDDGGGGDSHNEDDVPGAVKPVAGRRRGGDSPADTPSPTRPSPPASDNSDRDDPTTALAALAPSSPSSQLPASPTWFSALTSPAPTLRRRSSTGARPSQAGRRRSSSLSTSPAPHYRRGGGLTTSAPPPLPTRVILLRYWVVVALCHAARCAVCYPLGGTCAAVGGWAAPGVALAAVWLQLSLTDGAGLVYRLAVLPFLGAYVRRVRVAGGRVAWAAATGGGGGRAGAGRSSARGGGGGGGGGGMGSGGGGTDGHAPDSATNSPPASALASPAGSGMIFLRLATAMGLLSASQAEWLTLAAEEGGFVALGSIFFITPRPLTYLGTLAVGFVFPAYLSAAAVSAAPAGAVGGGALAADARRRQRRWLTYWTALAALDGLLLGPAGGVADWLPLWYHVRLGVLLWLQLPCVGGANTVCGLVVRWVAAVVGAVGRVVRWINRRRGGGSCAGDSTARKRKRM